MRARMALAAVMALVWLPGSGVQAQEAGAAAPTTVSHGISAFGELKYPADFDHFDYRDPGAPQGGTMSFRGQGASQTFDSLNLFILAGEPAQGLGRIYDSLLVRAYDEPDAAYGLVAESIEYPADRSWAVFRMRPEATFTDGVPITAEDVVWTLETLKAEGAPRWQITVADIESATALDAHTVRFDFTPGAVTRDLPSEAGQLPILPRHYYQEVAFDRSTLEPPVGSGPYVVSQVSPGRSITYCRTPDYWGADLPVNRGGLTFDCYRYEYFADATAAFEALKTGGYLFHQEAMAAIWATGYDFPALAKGWVVREELPDERPSGAQGYWLNLRRETFRDPRVREAIGMMFNFEWTNETLFYGLYERTDSFWENSSLQAEGVPEGDELALLREFEGQLPPGVLTEPAYVPPEGAAQQIDRASVRAASALLEEAGWSVGADGLRRNAAGKTLRVEIVDDNPAFQRINLPFVDNLRRIGIDAVATLIDSAQMQQRQEDFDYDIALGRFSLTMTPSVELNTLFGSQSADAKGTFNLSGVADPVVDALIGRVLAATSRDEMVTAVHALDRVLRAMHIWVPQWYSGVYRVAYWDVFGRPATKPAFERGDNYWWIDADRMARMQQLGALR